ncbi:unnamed protein product [Didymodactylos carnosus]|uniref:Uncharacterized protein n=1 Tax=Didymodactylos carnosus TaxID=1234261 RepID=A0A814UZV5_9BILA|nr:unnamed protein product [Didymodactylos carnosus]CAF1181477.1 unnamed protein product [Didymodactylos carnosus]CAF3792060.1 unnamed protein product [Didymodactylos carnosus]CAF3945810.1 unnamed protein product [Didymodactylos carnosus]
MKLFILVGLLFQICNCGPVKFNKTELVAVPLCTVNTTHNVASFNIEELVNATWFGLIRTTFIYGSNTWKNVVIQGSISNDTIQIDFIGENSMSECEKSESLFINLKSNSSGQIDTRWQHQQGFIEIISAQNNSQVELFLCYSLNPNDTICPLNNTELIVITRDTSKNDNVMFKNCAIKKEDIVTSDNLMKCLLPSTRSNAIVPSVNISLNTSTISQTNETAIVIEGIITHSNYTVERPTVLLINVTKLNETLVTNDSAVRSPLATTLPTATEGFGNDFTTRTNRRHRLEIVEEYYNNMSTITTTQDTIDDKIKVTMKSLASTTMEIMENSTGIEAVSPYASNQTTNYSEHYEVLTQTVIPEQKSNVTITIYGEVVEEKIVYFNGTSKETFIDHTTPSNEGTELPIDDSSSLVREFMPNTSINTFTEQTVSQNTSKFQDDNSTSTVVAVVVVVTGHNVTQTTFLMENVTENLNESVTNSNTTSTLSETTLQTSPPSTQSPAHCLPLKDCPFDYCAFARKFDHNNCPTCNCLRSDTSNITCPIMSCQSCLYGHYTDPNGCPICRCQSRPYPDAGEQCPELNCPPCYFGTVKDEYNCNTCICIRPNADECPVLNCPFTCKYGSTKDEENCPTCECLKSVFPDAPTCPVLMSCPACHLGYVKNSNGCETCQCKTRGSVSCVPVTCYCEFGSYLNSDGCETCNCLPDPKNVSLRACWELAAEANLTNTSGPQCSEDGTYYPKQCNFNSCWCVTSSGIKIGNFESTIEEAESMNCGCAVELYKVSNLRLIGHQLFCLLNGNYDHIQCVGRSCSCVDEFGKPIGPSVSYQKRDQLRCVGVWQNLYPERFLPQRNTARPQNVLTPSLCVTHREQVLNSTITDDHVLIPVSLFS